MQQTEPQFSGNTTSGGLSFEISPTSSSAGSDCGGNARPVCERDCTAATLPEPSRDLPPSQRSCSEDSGTSGACSSLLSAATVDQLELQLAPVGKRCYSCRRLLPIEAFAVIRNRKVPGKEFRNPRCSRCRAYRQKGSPRVQAMRAWLSEQKARPCKDCGQVFPEVCMDFDHVVGEKQWNIAAMIVGGRSFEQLKEEVSKCELVCSNCHRVRTAKRLASGQATCRRGRKPKFLAEVGTELLESVPGPRSLLTNYRRSTP